MLIRKISWDSKESENFGLRSNIETQNSLESYVKQQNSLVQDFEKGIYLSVKN